MKQHVTAFIHRLHKLEAFASGMAEAGLLAYPSLRKLAREASA